MWRIIPILEYLIVRWENMAMQPKYDEISDSITAGLDNLAKWYRTTDDSDAYFVCMGTYTFYTSVKYALLITYH